MKNLKFYSFLLLLLISFSFSACNQDKTIYVALTKGSGSEHYKMYSKWIESFDKNIKTIDFYKMKFEDAIDSLKLCSGIVLTGGPDVHPFYFGKTQDTARCYIDMRRDSLEFLLIAEAEKLELPILGICRGEQIYNVHRGGSLIVDIPEDHPSEIQHRCEDPVNCFHDVEIVNNTILKDLSNISRSSVNTNHHQAVDILADDFIVSARSDDGVIEAYEWKNKEGKPWMLAVQWHPERMDYESPLSKPIGKEFIRHVIAYEETKSKNLARSK